MLETYQFGLQYLWYTVTLSTSCRFVMLIVETSFSEGLSEQSSVAIAGYSSHWCDVSYITLYDIVFLWKFTIFELIEESQKAQLSCNIQSEKFFSPERNAKEILIRLVYDFAFYYHSTQRTVVVQGSVQESRHPEVLSPGCVRKDLWCKT